MGRSFKRKPQVKAAVKVPRKTSDISTYFDRRDMSGVSGSDISAPVSPSLPGTSQGVRGAANPQGIQEYNQEDSPIRGEQMEALKTLLERLPTTEAVEKMVGRLELTYQKGLDGLREDLQGIGRRINIIEDTIPTLSAGISELQTVIAEHHQQIQNLWGQIEDMEDRHRRNNIRLRGIPESVGEGELKHAVSKICNSLLRKAPEEVLELERIHRIPGYRNPNLPYPRDVLCGFHYYHQKEEVMKRARESGPIDLDGSKVTLFSDISRQTREKRKALRPLTQALIAAAIPYSWGFPFQLRVRKEGHVYVLQSPKDLQQFTRQLNLPLVEISQWPGPPAPRLSAPVEGIEWEKPRRSTRRKLEMQLKKID